MQFNYFRHLLRIVLLAAISTHSFAAVENNGTTLEGIPLSKLQELVEIMNQVKTYHVEEISTEDLFQHAMSGMVSSIDPHSAYLTAEDFEDLRISTTGKFGGLGIEVTLENDVVRVIAPIDDTPAAKAGIQPGDMIVRLDNKAVQGMSLREAVDTMRGPEGTPIKLTIARADEPKLLEFKLNRAVIKVQNVKTYLLEPGYAYVRITHFQENTAREMQQAIIRLRKESHGQLKGLILDLRNNPGGVLDAAVKVSDTFLDADKIGYDSVIVYTKSRVEQSQLLEKAKGKDLTNHAPMVVLVNAGSASASEIVAGALQDHKRALIIGGTTFGKGSVQTVLPLRNNKALKLTTAYYYTPSGRSIQKGGIEPDIEIATEEIIHTVIEEPILEKTPSNKIKTEADAEKLLAEDFEVQEALDVLKEVNAKKRKHNS